MSVYFFCWSSKATDIKISIFSVDCLRQWYIFLSIVLNSCRPLKTDFVVGHVKQLIKIDIFNIGQLKRPT
jgi:hypothetical protein